ncbi:hypothetical protein ZEAMMB73_Zm00001d029114 [Zea mays]|uniref:Uncharacterized protein n=1 Tax=Zea mays TaxID=4577 RepID=A0A1D6K2N7_MAIZE|nr:hypothetical protein ZEAMMB73_Zm00001d029114 [Zea mays]
MLPSAPGMYSKQLTIFLYDIVPRINKYSSERLKNGIKR